MFKYYEKKWMAAIALIPIVNLLFVLMYFANSTQESFRKHGIYMAGYVLAAILIFNFLPDSIGLLKIWIVTTLGSLLALIGLWDAKIYDMRTTRKRCLIIICVIVALVGILVALFASLLYSTQINDRTKTMLEAMVDDDYELWCEQLYPNTDMKEVFYQEDINGEIDMMLPISLSYKSSGPDKRLYVKYIAEIGNSSYTVEVVYEETLGKKGVSAISIDRR